MAQTLRLGLVYGVRNKIILSKIYFIWLYVEAYRIKFMEFFSGTSAKLGLCISGCLGITVVCQKALVQRVKKDLYMHLTVSHDN